MRVLTSKEIDAVSAGFCPVCFIIGASTILVSASGATLAILGSQQMLIVGASGLAVGLSILSGFLLNDFINTPYDSVGPISCC